MKVTYSSKYPRLIFFVNDVRYRFVNGIFVTDDPDIIKVLDLAPEVTKIPSPEISSLVPSDSKEKGSSSTAPAPITSALRRRS